MEAIIEDKTPLYEYWDELQVVMEIDLDLFDSLLDQEVRRAIVEKLAVGIVDEDYDKNKKRHAMSATELRKKINEKKSPENEVNSSNLYFHLQKLEEAGLIKVVGQIPTGKRLTTYYGRTAKTFIPKKNHEEKATICKELDNDDLAIFVDKLNPQVTQGEINEIIDRARKIGQNNIQTFKEWIKENTENFKGVDLDFRKLLELYNLLHNLDEETFKSLNRLSQLLKIKQ